VIDLSHATLPQIAAELRRRAEVHDAGEVSEAASIADVLFNYNPRRAERLRRVAEWLEAMENGM
jgi:hypothetical protein